MSRLTWAPPHMAVGYHPTCSSKPGAYPCFPIMPRFGLTGLGRGGARMGRGDGPVFVGGGAPTDPQLGGRVFGRGFRFPSADGPFFSDGSVAGWWPQWLSSSSCPSYSYPFYSYPALPKSRSMGFGAMRPVNPLVPRYGLSDLSQDGSGLFGTGLFGNNWGMPEVYTVLLGGLVLYSMFFTTTTKVKRGYLALEGKAQKRRKSRAAKYRAKAKALEAKGLGGVFA